VGRKRAEILIGKALRDAATMTLDRYLFTGLAVVPDVAGMALARVLARFWRLSIRDESLKVQRQVGEVKAEGNIWEQFLAEYVRQYGAQAVRDILETTRRQIVAAVDRGLQDGKGIDQIAKEVREAIPAMTRGRAAIIARTETHSAAQYASIETAKKYPFKVNKVWNSVSDPRTRDFGEGDGVADQANHRAMNGVMVAIDEPFMVPNKWGGRDAMQYPGDQSAPAYQCVNCRCNLSYKRAARVIG
jgi:Phage Mu protein F like protein